MVEPSSKILVKETCITFSLTTISTKCATTNTLGLWLSNKPFQRYKRYFSFGLKITNMLGFGDGLRLSG